MRLVVVIPTLNEESAIPSAVACALAIGDEVVVSDGGSGDATVSLAEHAGARVVTGPAGRGEQLNRGARGSDAEALLFLHADTRLPVDAGPGIRDAVASGAVGGGFRIAFDSAELRFRFAARLINARTALSRTPLGDQAQFATRAAFDTLGGFRPFPILEDFDFARRLRGLGTVAILPGPATTSARRYLRRGLLRTTANNWLIWSLYLAGMSPARLARLYQHIR